MVEDAALGPPAQHTRHAHGAGARAAGPRLARAAFPRALPHDGRATRPRRTRRSRGREVRIALDLWARAPAPTRRWPRRRRSRSADCPSTRRSRTAAGRPRSTHDSTTGLPGSVVGMRGAIQDRLAHVDPHARHPALTHLQIQLAARRRRFRSAASPAGRSRDRRRTWRHTGCRCRTFPPRDPSALNICIRASATSRRANQDQSVARRRRTAGGRSDGPAPPDRRATARAKQSTYT